MTWQGIAILALLAWSVVATVAAWWLGAKLLKVEEHRPNREYLLRERERVQELQDELDKIREEYAERSKRLPTKTDLADLDRDLTALRKRLR